MNRRVKIIVWVWITIVFADYYLQFFTSRYWTDHAFRFLSSLGGPP